MRESCENRFRWKSLVDKCKTLRRAQFIHPAKRRKVVALPVLGNVEAPLKLEVGDLVVVDEAGDGVVVATGKHA